MVKVRRAPYGARGLKSRRPAKPLTRKMSRPVWGAWIEMKLFTVKGIKLSSRPVWGAWIEIEYQVNTRM